MIRTLTAALLALVLAEARDLPPQGLDSTPTCDQACVVLPPDQIA
jgi:hypothetical protein